MITMITMMNAAFRIFWGQGIDENAVNTLNSTTPTAPYALEETLQHISQCVMFSYDDCEDSLVLLGHYFPWLTVNCTLNENLGAEKKTLSPAHMGVIREQNALDILAYDYSRALFQAQLAAVRLQQQHTQQQQQHTQQQQQHTQHTQQQKHYRHHHPDPVFLSTRHSKIPS